MDLIKIITNYYLDIDSGHIEKILLIFSEDIIYKRGEKSFIGKKELSDFYFSERKLKGFHEIENIICQNNLVIVKGDYKKDDGGVIEFMDWFEFDNNLIIKRNSYFGFGFNLSK